MKTTIAPVIALAAALCAFGASAQDAEAVFPPAPEGAVPQAEAPAPAPPEVAPQPAPAPAATCPAPARGIELALYAEHAAQANRRSREIDRLNAVMDREGSDFSEERFEAYRARLTGGGILIALGGASMFAAMVTGITLDIDSGSSSDDEDGYGESSDEDDGRSDLLPGLPLGLLFGGIAAVGIGIPLAISGARGKKRQELLRRKDEILTPYDPQGAYVSFVFDPERGSGGVQLKLTF